MATHKTGGEVDAFCTRCKMDLAHTILAMVGTKVVRVRCNTCGGDHAFRGKQESASSARPARAPTPRASSGGGGSTKAERAVVSFEEQLAGKDVANAPRYSPQTTYAVDQVLHHPTFGVGLVREVRGDKVEVAFRVETKTLVHGRSGAPAARPAFQPPSAPRSGPADKPLAPGAAEAEPASQDGEQA
jgi:hypothetical protein